MGNSTSKAHSLNEFLDCHARGCRGCPSRKAATVLLGALCGLRYKPALRLCGEDDGGDEHEGSSDETTASAVHTSTDKNVPTIASTVPAAMPPRLSSERG